MKRILNGTLAMLLCASASLPAYTQTVPPPAAAAAQAQANPALLQRVEELAAVISGTTEPSAFFTPTFLANVPAERFKATNVQLLKSAGAIQDVRLVSADTPFSGMVELTYEKTKGRMRITVDSAAPHLVSGLRMMGMASGEENMGAVIAALRALPGQTAITVARLEESGPAPMIQINGDQVLAIGSEFKLIILAELVRAVTAGERNWDDKVTLGNQQLPSGFYAGKPASTTATLRELAEKMISVSDNSATDILLASLGREKVEAMMTTVGIADPSRNKPFLFTLEANKLKGRSEAGYGQRYGALDEAGKRALLAKEIAEARAMTATQAAAATAGNAAPASAPGPRKPNLIETVEWFASPADMVRVMDWLRRNTETGPAAEARAILSRNPGLPPETAGKWAYTGFKGGSEAGVIASTFLLQAKDGRWYAVSAKWNNREAEVENQRFLALISRAIDLIAPR